MPKLSFHRRIRWASNSDYQWLGPRPKVWVLKIQQRQGKPYEAAPAQSARVLLDEASVGSRRTDVHTWEREKREKMRDRAKSKAQDRNGAEA